MKGGPTPCELSPLFTQFSLLLGCSISFDIRAFVVSGTMVTGGTSNLPSNNDVRGMEYTDYAIAQLKSISE